MFVSMNAALLVGFWRWISGAQGGAWKRTVRSQEIAPANSQSASAGTVAKRKVSAK
jgi:hypothetical protein